ncbi:hypothetical protein [uncultured Williamsia sp.]|uniref:hypothetical protein n=1 Tax=uncultured Williamsia sp. TaxID=259311 RepID=UPI002615360B|nr:hypothetical protein [uncultured Williamsia sp.]
MKELQEDAGFGTFRDILLLAAGIGFHFNRRASYSDAAGDPIRYETMTAPVHSEALINMIAANIVGNDPEILDAPRLEERVRIFEEFANGGLDVIQEQVNVRHLTADLVVDALISEALASGGGAAPASVDELLRGVSWS